MTDQHQLGPLLKRVQAGDARAMEDLLARIRPYLHLLVLQRTEPEEQNRLGNSDIVQETLLRVHNGLKPETQGAAGHFQGRGLPEFLGWVSKIVENVIVDLKRHARAGKRDERREVTGSSLFATFGGENSPEQNAERSERALLLAAAVGRLPAHKRDVVSWRFFQQLTFEEISQRTGKGVVALRVLCTRALKDLREDSQLARQMGAEA
jgi:RNA polymerase sigma factor (sigma-70 family)